MFDPKMKDAFWGFIVGDAFGVPFEFRDRDEMKEYPATDMIGHGTFNQPIGTWSDDTSMMLCVMENMWNKGDVASLSRLFIRWYVEGYHTPHWEAFDIGNTTRESIERLMAGEHPNQSGSSDEWSAGNGSLMRTVPYTLADNPFSENISKMSIEHSITHSLSICTESSIFYARMLRSLADGTSKEESLKSAISYLRYLWRIVEYYNEDEFIHHSQKFSRLFSDHFYDLKEEAISSSGYVIDTLEACIWSFMHSTSYADAILRAVNLGNDTDTIAALTGALAGVYYGYDDIPEKWLKQIVGKDELTRQFPFL